METIPLGGFDLEEPIGKGGMGEVWRGVHRQSREQVAVKVLTAKGARNDTILQFFRNEVRAVAGLDHPDVVTVLDYGAVPPETDALSWGKVMEGSPWLAMELIKGGTLKDRCGKVDWPEARILLLRILDALAHAHARGVIHRDIKPSNVLIDQDGGSKISDFGLAHAVDREAIHEYCGGSPAYMAP